MFSIKNAAYVAVMQTGVIVVGVLGAGLWVKARHELGWALPIPIALLTNHPLVFFGIPLVWIAVASVLNNRPSISDGVKSLALFSGVLVLIGLVVFVLYADLSPLSGIMWGLAGDDDH